MEIGGDKAGQRGMRYCVKRHKGPSSYSLQQQRHNAPVRWGEIEVKCGAEVFIRL